MEGWSINENLASYFFDDQKLPESPREIQKVLIDEDLREFGEPIFQNLIDKNTTNLDLSTSPKVVQLVKFRNVQIPKIRESSENVSDNSAIFRIFLTDGHSTISGIIMENIKGLTTETPPGTKCKIHGKINIESNFLLLTKNNIQIIGGNVEKLIEKWKIEKSGEKTTKSASLAPKWVPFGKRQKQNESAPKLDKNFKANQVLPKKESNENESTEFSKNREEVLKNLESEDQKVFSRPNVQVPEKVPTQPKTRPQTMTTTEKPEKFGKKPRRGRKNSEDDDEPLPDYVKPGNAPTLFDFIGATTGIEEEIQKMNIQKQRDQKSFTPRSAPSNQQHHQGSSSHREQPRRNQGLQTRSFPENHRKGEANSRENAQNQGESRRNDNQKGPRNHENKGIQGESRRNDNQKGPRNQENKNNHGERRNDNQKGPRNHENKGQNYNSPKESNRGETSRKQFNNSSKPSPAKNQNYSNPGDVRLSGGNRQPIGDNSRTNYQQNVNRAPQSNSDSRYFQPQQQTPMWQIGSQCMAPWNDGRIYPAEILQFLPNRQCVIRYSEYGNTTEIPIDVLMYC